MRFKAEFTQRGLRILEKGFLPSLEKFGKTCQLLVGPEDVHFVQTTVNTDGTHITARFAVDVLFHPETYKLQSKHHNLIAFTVDLALLSRVIRGAGANAADSLEVKLTQKSVLVPGSEEEQSKPFLSFAGKGHSLSMVQDLPISKPFIPGEIDRLVAAKEVPNMCPYYLDLKPCTAQLQAMVDRMKSIGDTLVFATCKNGDAHLHVAAINILLGTQVRNLNVFPVTAGTDGGIDRSQTAEQQLQAAIEAGCGVAVYVQLKHLSRVLNASQLTTPSQILCGIAEGGSYVHVMYVYRDTTKDAAYDESIALTFKLPVKMEDA